MLKQDKMFLLFFIVLNIIVFSAHTSEMTPQKSRSNFAWMTNLGVAIKKALAEKKPLLVLFRCEP